MPYYVLQNRVTKFYWLHSRAVWSEKPRGKMYDSKEQAKAFAKRINAEVLPATKPSRKSNHTMTRKRKN